VLTWGEKVKAPRASPIEVAGAVNAALTVTAADGGDVTVSGVDALSVTCSSKK
jgi:hypothetical protein